MLLLVTGATGKVGTNLIAHILAEPRWSGMQDKGPVSQSVVSRNRQGGSCQR